MALAFGGGVRPELGRTDYGAVARGSEIAAQLSAQGSQMMGQGLAKALQGAGAAVRGYQERKQEKRFTEQTLTNLGNFFKDNPDAVTQLGFNVDPNDKGALKAAVQGFGGGDFKMGAAAISPLMAQYMQQQEKQKAQAVQQQAMADAFAPEVTAGPSAFQRAVMGGVGFGDLPTDAASSLQPINSRERSAREVTQRLLAGGMQAGPAAAIYSTLASAENAQQRTDNRPSKVISPEAIPQTPDEAYKVAGLTPENSKVLWQNNRYVAVPLNQKELADLEKIENDKQQAIIKGDTEKVNLINQVKAAREEIDDTISLIDQAISLAEAKTGGPVAGTAPIRKLGAMATALPGVGKIFRAAGSDYGVRLKSLYDTIRARLTFDKIGALKSLSASGSTGLGPTSNLEFTALGDSAGQIAVNLPEDMQLAYLQTMRKTLQRLRNQKGGSADNSAKGDSTSRGIMPISPEVDAALKEFGL